MSIGAIDLSNYFSSLKDTTVDPSNDPYFSLETAPYSPTNAATIPTTQMTSPYSTLKQWSMDAQAPAVAAKPADNTMIYIALAAVAAFLFLRHR